MPLDLENGLVDDAKAGGPAIERLIAAIWPEAFRIAYGILRDRGLAEDAAQDACASIAAALPQLKRTAGFAAWAYTTITRKAISAARRRHRTEDLHAVVERGSDRAALIHDTLSSHARAPPMHGVTVPLRPLHHPVTGSTMKVRVITP